MSATPLSALSLTTANSLSTVLLVLLEMLHALPKEQDLWKASSQIVHADQAPGTVSWSWLYRIVPDRRCQEMADFTLGRLGG